MTLIPNERLALTTAGRVVTLEDFKGHAGPSLRPQNVVLTLEEHRALLERAEDAEDAALARAMEAAGIDPDETMPMAAADRLYAGEHPLRVWRDVRGLTLVQLGRAAGIGASYISEIETVKKPGSVDALQKLARALRVSIDDLVADDRMSGEETP